MTIKGKFKVDIYNCNVHITYADNDASLLRSINHCLRLYEEDKEETSPRGYAFSPKSDIQNYFVFFGKNDMTIEIFNHEKSHIVDFILEDRGIQTSDEVRSYLDGFISHKLNSFFTKRKIKIKNHR